MEIVDRGREAAVHRRSQTAASAAHEGASRLQVPAPSQTENAAQGRISLLAAVSFRLHGRPPCRSAHCPLLLLNYHRIIQLPFPSAEMIKNGLFLYE